MMRRSRGDGVRVFVGAASVVLVGVLLLGACGRAGPPAEEQKTVPIGVMLAMTGGAGGPTQYSFTAMQDYVDYFNEEEMIPGVELQLAWIDTGTDELREISAYQRFLAQEVPLILSIADSEKFKTPCEKDQLPMITQSMTGNPLYPAGWIYGIYMPWWESFAVWCEWILDNWKEDRPPKIVVIGPDTTAGPIAVEPAIPYVERMGAEVLQPEYVSGYAPLDSSTQLMRIERNGADFVYILPIWTISSVVLKDAERLGLVGKVRFGGMENTQSPKLIEAAQSAADGYTAPRFAPYIGETDIEGIQMIRDLRSRYGRGVGFAGDDAHGFVTAVVGCEAIKRAVERVGYENLNGAAVKEALDSMKDWDVYGIKTITYSADDVRGWTGVRIYEIQSGQIVPVSDWVEAPSIVP